jgi:hypothetical protein
MIIDSASRSFFHPPLPDSDSEEAPIRHWGFPDPHNGYGDRVWGIGLRGSTVGLCYRPPSSSVIPRTIGSVPFWAEVNNSTDVLRHVGKCPPHEPRHDRSTITLMSVDSS